jgi:hypothetical protein
MSDISPITSWETILQEYGKKIKLHVMRKALASVLRKGFDAPKIPTTPAKSMRRKAVLFLFICFSLCVIGLAFHHHADGGSHSDCSICFHVAHHSTLAFQDIPQISAPVSAILPVFLENAVSPSPLRCAPYSNRAPPA